MTADEIFKSYRKEKASFVTSQKQRTEGATNEPYDDFVEHVSSKTFERHSSNAVRHCLHTV
jgi:hypothetical protein